MIHVRLVTKPRLLRRFRHLRFPVKRRRSEDDGSDESNPGLMTKRPWIIRYAFQTAEIAAVLTKFLKMSLLGPFFSFALFAVRALLMERKNDGDVPLPEVRDRQRPAFDAAALPLRVTILRQ